MNNEQLEKRVKWLDDERRKDKTIIAKLEDRLMELESKLGLIDKKSLEIDSDLTRFRTSMARIDDFEASLSEFRLDWKKEQKDQEKQIKSWINDAKKDLRARIQGIETTQKKQIENFKRVKGLEKDMHTREEEDNRLNASLREIEKSFGDVQKEHIEYQRATRVVKEERQRESKRLSDIGGEQTALRKRVDEIRGLLDLVKGDYQKIKNQTKEMESFRKELKIDHDTFLEDVNLQMIDRETAWKNWMMRFDSIEKQAKDLDEEMTKLDSTHRGVKRMQDELKDLSSLLDRRVHEITEMQRLEDEKFRAEWNTFATDDQKRWTNYTIAQKEQAKLLERQYKEDENRITLLEDGYQDIDDQLSQISKYSENQLQTLLSLMREWAGEFEQIMDGFR